MFPDAAPGSLNARESTNNFPQKRSPAGFDKTSQKFQENPAALSRECHLSYLRPVASTALHKGIGLAARQFQLGDIHMKLMKTLSAGVAAIAITAAFSAAVAPTPVMAQSITSTIRGAVTSSDGAPVSGATVTVVDSRSGATRTVTTGANGQFSVPNLEVGGPYVVTVVSRDYQNSRAEDVYTNISDTTNLSFRLEAAGGAADEIVVVAARSIQTDIAIGPNSVFNEQTLGDLPSIGRDIRDVLRLDPRVKIDPTNGDAVSCVGANNRFNSFTVDGVRNNDTFGLNASGFVNRNGMPIPFDAIRETSVEFAPFDVQYNQFTGCNINAVTKSGSNEFHGSGFAVFNSQSLTGSSLEGNETNTVPFRDYTWGATLGGPVIEDKLFFFVGYEQYKKNRPQANGPAGGGFANEMSFVTVDEANDIADALEARGISTGGITSVLPSESRRILTRWDWNINDNHRLAFTYQRLNEFETIQDDLSTSNNLFAFGGNFYERGTKSQTYSARLFSNWTDNFSTEIRASRADVHDLQDPVGGGEAQSGNPIPRVIIGVNDGAVIAGPGFSRAANQLDTQTDTIRAKADWTLGQHTLTFGYEFDQVDIYNLFAQNATGTLAFANLADFEAGLLLNTGSSTFITGTTIANGTAAGASINAPFSDDINDAAALFSRSIHSLFAQDSIDLTPNLTALIGMRYDFYKSGDTPLENPRFEERYGFSNAVGLDGLSAFLPRLGLTYDAGDTLMGQTRFRAGAGVFTGGDPGVWFSNAFSNPGTTLSGPNVTINNAISGGYCTAADYDIGTTGALAVPACLAEAAQAAAQAADGRVDAIDPDFKIPTVIRSNIGLTHTFDFGGNGFFDGWVAQLDIIYSRGRNSYDVVDVALHEAGTTIDGRPYFVYVDPLKAGCDAVRDGGLRDGWSNVTAACSTGSFAQGARQSMVLTNAEQGDRSWTFSAIFDKNFDFNGITGNAAGFDVTLGYAYSDAKDSMPGTSSVSTSNYNNIATDNIGAFPLTTSNYQIRHNVTVSTTYRDEFFKDLQSSFSFFFSARSGQPYSLTYRNGNAFGEAGTTNRALMYIPTGPSDPNVVFGPGFDTDAYFAFLESIGAMKYAGGIAPRNAFRSDWYFDLDFRFQQELPSIIGVKPKFFVDLENMLNLISDDANILKQVSFPYGANTVVLGAANPQGNPYQYNSFVAAGADQNINVDASLWRLQFGLRFDF